MAVVAPAGLTGLHATLVKGGCPYLANLMRRQRPCGGEVGSSREKRLLALEDWQDTVLTQPMDVEV
jgi:hypothetical protein